MDRRFNPTSRSAEPENDVQLVATLMVPILLIFFYLSMGKAKRFWRWFEQVTK